MRAKALFAFSPVCTVRWPRWLLWRCSCLDRAPLQPSEGQGAISPARAAQNALRDAGAMEASMRQSNTAFKAFINSPNKFPSQVAFTSYSFLLRTESARGRRREGSSAAAGWQRVGWGRVLCE